MLSTELRLCTSSTHLWIQIQTICSLWTGNWVNNPYRIPKWIHVSGKHSTTMRRCVLTIWDNRIGQSSGLCQFAMNGCDIHTVIASVPNWFIWLRSRMKLSLCSILAEAAEPFNYKQTPAKLTACVPFRIVCQCETHAWIIQCQHRKASIGKAAERSRSENDLFHSLDIKSLRLREHICRLQRRWIKLTFSSIFPLLSGYSTGSRAHENRLCFVSVCARRGRRIYDSFIR